MNTHSHIHDRSSLPTPCAGLPSPVQPRPVLRPGILAWVLLAAILAVVIASSVANSGADRVAAERAAARGGVPVGLVGGFQGTQRQGIVHAPPGYSPPGIWTSPKGPVVR